MRLARLEREQLVRRPLDEVFEFFSQAENLERITPPWLNFTLVTPLPIVMRTGTLIEYRLRLHGIPVRWVSRIEQWERGRRFVDVQVRGPYKVWRHLHEFTATAAGTHMRDRVDYALPFGRAGATLGLAPVARELARIFDYRRAAVADILR